MNPLRELGLDLTRRQFFGRLTDGLSAGLAVAEALGGQRPWQCDDASPAGRNARPVQVDQLAAAE